MYENVYRSTEGHKSAEKYSLINENHQCLSFLFVFFVHSQPLVMCRQCPGYRREVNQMLFATGSTYWLPGLPAPPAIPSPPKPATEEGTPKPTGEQPSTSSDIPSGDYECRLDEKISC